MKMKALSWLLVVSWWLLLAWCGPAQKTGWEVVNWWQPQVQIDQNMQQEFTEKTWAEVWENWEVSDVESVMSQKKPTNSENELNVVWMTKEEAEATLTQNNIPFRYKSIDWEDLPMTLDLVDWRYNLVSENWKITEQDVERI